MNAENLPEKAAELLRKIRRTYQVRLEDLKVRDIP